MRQQLKQWTRLNLWQTVAVSMLAAMIAASSSTAFTTVIDSSAGVEDDTYANGRLIDTSNSGTVANWALTTSVSGTDFANDALTGGPNGLEYVMLNTVMDSRAVNSIRYDVTPAAGYSIQSVSVMQSPYHNGGTWNGGNAEIAQFVLSWSGGGVAMVADPDDQLYAFSTGTPIVSGTTVRFDDVQAYNSDDSWRIDLPTGANSVRVNWSSANPSANSDLTREWVAFDSNIVQVPEPTTLALLGIALIGFFGVRRFHS